jgi:Leucine-rich repeat (LRR) protein
MFTNVLRDSVNLCCSTQYEIKIDSFDVATRVLLLSHNSIEVIPANFSIMVNLTRLTLVNNFIQVIPDSFSLLVNLQGLFLAMNYISDLPTNFSRLANLKTLTLSENCFRHIPDVLYELAQDCEIDMKVNPFTQEAIKNKRADRNIKCSIGFRSIKLD